MSRLVVRNNLIRSKPKTSPKDMEQVVAKRYTSQMIRFLVIITDSRAQLFETSGGLGSSIPGESLSTEAQFVWQRIRPRKNIWSTLQPPVAHELLGCVLITSPTCSIETRHPPRIGHFPGCITAIFNLRGGTGRGWFRVQGVQGSEFRV